MTLEAKEADLSGESADLWTALSEQRELLLITVRNIEDAAARQRSTTSELTLGGLIKHLARMQSVWTHVLAERPGAPDGMYDPDQYQPGDESLATLLHAYEESTRSLLEVLSGVDDLERQVQLPDAPWGPGDPIFWSGRRILLHVLRETAQHSGHADIIREELDGSSTTQQRAG